jgi:hypothetical protein
MVVASHAQVNWQAVEVLDETERGAGGFGHTGKNKHLELIYEGNNCLYNSIFFLSIGICKKGKRERTC